MLPPSQAIITSVRGKPGDPAQIGVAAGDEHIAGGLIALHKAFVLNVPAVSMIHGFDVIHFSSGKPGDKFAKSGFTRGRATVVNAPTLGQRVGHIGPSVGRRDTRY